VQVELGTGMQRVHAVIRKGIQSILGAWPEGQFSGADGEEAVQLTKDLKPDFMLIAISVPGMGGLEVTRAIPKVCPDAKLVMLTLHDSLEWVGGAPCRCSRLLVEIGYGRRNDARLERAGGNGIYASPGLDPDRVKRIVLQLGLIV
jgi:CheY-like chemotaxis protein